MSIVPRDGAVWIKDGGIISGTHLQSSGTVTSSGVVRCTGVPCAVAVQPAPRISCSSPSGSFVVYKDSDGKLTNPIWNQPIQLRLIDCNTYSYWSGYSNTITPSDDSSDTCIKQLLQCIPCSGVTIELYQNSTGIPKVVADKQLNVSYYIVPTLQDTMSETGLNKDFYIQPRQPQSDIQVYADPQHLYYICNPSYLLSVYQWGQARPDWIPGVYGGSGSWNPQSDGDGSSIASYRLYNGKAYNEQTYQQQGAYIDRYGIPGALVPQRFFINQSQARQYVNSAITGHQWQFNVIMSDSIMSRDSTLQYIHSSSDCRIVDGGVVAGAKSQMSKRYCYYGGSDWSLQQIKSSLCPVYCDAFSQLKYPIYAQVFPQNISAASDYLQFCSDVAASGWSAYASRQLTSADTQYILQSTQGDTIIIQITNYVAPINKCREYTKSCSGYLDEQSLKCPHNLIRYRGFSQGTNTLRITGSITTNSRLFSYQASIPGLFGDSRYASYVALKATMDQYIGDDTYIFSVQVVDVGQPSNSWQACVATKLGVGGLLTGILARGDGVNFNIIGVAASATVSIYVRRCHTETDDVYIYTGTDPLQSYTPQCGQGCFTDQLFNASAYIYRYPFTQIQIPCSVNRSSCTSSGNDTLSSLMSQLPEELR